MSTILRVISRNQKQFDRFKAAFAKYPAGDNGEQAILYRVTKPEHLSLIGTKVPAIVVLPKGFDCMKAWEEKAIKDKAKAHLWKLYALTESKFKIFEQGASLVSETSGQALEKLIESEGGDAQ